MEKAEGALSIFIKKVGHDVFILLRFFQGKKDIFQAIVAASIIQLHILVVIFLSFHASIYGHEASDPSHEVIGESFEHVGDGILFWLCADIK